MLYAILFGTAYALSCLPLRVLYGISDALYLIVYKLIGYRTRVVRKNLRNAFPEKTDQERTLIERRFYHFFCDYIVETIKLTSMSKEEMQRRMTFSGVDIIDSQVRQGKGVACYLGHYCNWEWVTAIGMQIHGDAAVGQVYHVLESKVMDKLLLYIRGRMETQNIPMAEVLRRMISWKQEGKMPVIGFISDQTPILYNLPHWLTFLNQQTPFITGTERLAKKLGMAAIYFDISRPRRGHYHVEVKLLAEETRHMADWELTELYAREMERTIRRDPAYWLWSHNRWKRKPEDYFNAMKEVAKQG